MLRLLLIILLFFTLAGCGDGFSCHMGEMRCSGDEAQMSNADREWVDWLNCGLDGMGCYTDRAYRGGRRHRVLRSVMPSK